MNCDGPYRTVSFFGTTLAEHGHFTGWGLFAFILIIVTAGLLGAFGLEKLQ